MTVTSPFLQCGLTSKDLFVATGTGSTEAVVAIIEGCSEQQSWPPAHDHQEILAGWDSCRFTNYYWNHLEFKQFQIHSKGFNFFLQEE